MQTLDEIPEILRDVLPGPSMPPAPSEQQVFTASRGRRRKLSQKALEAGDEPMLANLGAQVFHETSERVTMYKPTDRGFVPKIVPADNIAMNLMNGWRESCPDCKGVCGPSVNDCPGRPKQKFMSCPICQKRFYAPRILVPHTGGTRLQPHDAGGRFAATGEQDVNELASPYAKVDLGAQLKARVDRHLLAFHQEEARALQIRALDVAGEVAGEARVV